MTTKSESAELKTKKNLNGVSGWLAVFTVGLGIGILINCFALSGYPSAFADLESLRSEMPDFVTAMTPVLWFEVAQFAVLITAAIALIVLILKRMAIAKIITILFIASTAILNVADYAWVAAIFNSQELDTELLGDSSGDIVRSVIIGFIWIPYFLISKRVKATLVK